MKKLLIVPMVLALIIFFLYPEEIDGMDTSTKGQVAQEIQIEEEILKKYNNSKNEINTSLEVNKTIEEEFSVEIKGELNTTKERVITLKADVKNAQNLEACNYWWYEGKELIDMGITLEKAFDKGEHNITLVVKDVNGEETNSSVMLSAYNYKSITTLHYDAYYGQLEYKESVIYNHKGQYLLFDDGTYSKELLTYDKNENLLERVKEYYRYAEQNTKTKYSYDDKGNQLTAQTFNADGISVEYRLNIYDENSILIDIKYGINPNDIDKNKISYYSEVIYDESEISREVDIPKDIVRKNNNGQIVYEELYYGDIKVVKKMTYNEENKLTKSESSSNSSYDFSTNIIDYDAKGNAINKERQYEMKGYPPCHYSSTNTYTDSNQIKSRVSTLLGGDCHYIDEVKRVYSYDEDGTVINVKASTDNGDITEAYTTLEVIKEYTNELDI